MDERFLKEEGREIFTGNELILKGGLESRMGLVTGYPGSPVSDVFDAAYANRELLKRHGILAQMANNEALSAARLNGARMAGIRALAVMKSVGVHVASDGLALGNLQEPRNDGGSVVVIGDDPWIESTQINNDSRFIAQHLHMPVLEPATFQEVKDWINVAFELSSRADLYIAYLLTTNQADGGGTVTVKPNQYPAVNTHAPITLDTSRIPLDDLVLLPPRTWWREATLGERYQRLWQEARRWSLNRILYSRPERFPIGLVTSGSSYVYLEHALYELGLSRQIPILKFGLTYPLDETIVLEFARQMRALYIVEEKRGFLEGQIMQILQRADPQGQAPRVPVWGKTFPGGRPGIPEQRGLNPSLLMEKLGPLFLETLAEVPGFDAAPLQRELARLQETSRYELRLSARTPTFCPGCPHRDSSSLLLEIKRDFMDAAYMRQKHGREPMDLVFHGETGCFTMLMFEPNRPLMHNYSGMGLGGGTGAGLDPFVTNKQVVFLGDSTFFHSGMIAISDSIKSGQDILYVILDNKTTAMTGHQPTPATETDLMGEKTFGQKIEAILQGMVEGSEIPVVRTNPTYRQRYRELLEDMVLQEGVKVVIADKECAITYHRRLKKEKKRILREEGFLPEERLVNITPDVCEFCLECTRITGCPGLTIEDTDFGPKIVTDLSSCVSDGACARVKACPSFEEVIVTRRAPPRRSALLPPFEKLPPPKILDFESVWYAYTAGVGGMGAGLLTAILARAAHRHGYGVLFSDKKGLAIRNGGVYAHILFSKDGTVLSPLVPYGKADLLLGIDILEAARGLDPSSNARVAHPDKTAAVVNTAKNPTILTLMGRDDFSVPDLEGVFQQYTRADRYMGFDFSAASERFFGTKLYANILLLGAAYQKGLLPLSAETLERAVTDSVPKEDRQTNLTAFRLGRACVVWPDSIRSKPHPPSYRGLLDEKADRLARAYGRRRARAYRRMVEEAVFQLGLEEAANRALALRVYELIQYEGLAYAARYVDKVLAVRARDREAFDYAATRIVLHNLFKVMLIKDEVYVAHLLTSEEKRERDRARFQMDEANGDRLVYRHFNRPQFTLFGRDFEWDMTTRDWQLRWVKRMKFLRRLLPGWHRREKAFRDWYIGLVDRFTADPETLYPLYVRALRVPESVTGYRKIRYPRMEEAQRQAEAALAQIASLSLPKNSPPRDPLLPRRQGSRGEGAPHEEFPRL